MTEEYIAQRQFPTYIEYYVELRLYSILYCIYVGRRNLRGTYYVILYTKYYTNLRHSPVHLTAHY